VERVNPDTPPNSLAAGVGGRTNFRVQALAAVSSDLEVSQDEMRPFLRDYCQIIIAGCRKMDRTCLNIYAQAMKLIGAQVELTVNLWGKLGVSGEGHARELIAQALDAQNMDRETAWRISEQFVQEYRRENGLPELVEARPNAADTV